jgi:ketosteroid isomerase-like protein
MSKNAPLVDACRKAYTGFEKNDRAQLLKFLADDVVFEFPKSLPYGGKYRGLAEFKAFWADLYENYYEYFHYNAHDVLDCGTHIVVPVAAHAKTKTGKTMENEHCFLFKVEDGKIVYGRIYADTAKGRDVLQGMTMHPSRASA